MNTSVSDVTPWVIGNWKMNGTRDSVRELDSLKARLAVTETATRVMICPPATLIAQFSLTAEGSRVEIGGQDCHAEDSGAYTGDLGAGMLKDAGASAVIVGHSERRTAHNETDDMVKAKAEAAHRAGLIAIICIGETLAQREANDTLPVLAGQLGGSLPAGATAANTIIAYEPVWAIGTGLTPTKYQIAEAHGLIRQRVAEQFPGEGERMALLYGGSVKPGNAKEIFAVEHVNGGLIGGASLKAEDFFGIIEAA